MNYNNGNIDFYPGSLGGGERYWRVVSPNKQPVVAGLLVIKSPKYIRQSFGEKGDQLSSVQYCFYYNTKEGQ